jgi:hypothetical protein
MIILPALEAALDEAAHRHYGRRRFHVPWRRVLVPALALGCALAALMTLTGRATGPAQEQPVGPPVPEATLAQSRALTQAPGIPKFTGREPVIAHADLPAVADAYEDATPYPPEGRDLFDWASTAAGPYDMSSISYAKDVQMLVEWRAACIWLRYWLASEGDAEARRAAALVLGDVPAWPTRRESPGNWADVPALVAAGDVAALDTQNRADCSPWRNRQNG